MAKPLRILFVPFGSEGDVNPLLWLAEGMAARGHQPTFVITPHYGRLLQQQRGFPWIPVGTEEDFVRFARDPRVWSRTHGTRRVVEGMVDTLPVYREAVESAGRDFDLVVLSSMALGAACMAEAAGIPRLTLHMQPALFRSVHECPLFMEELAWLTRSPRWLKRLSFALVDILFWEAARKPLNAFRKQLNLPPIKNFFEEAFHGAEGLAALFPDWFAAPQPDWPRNLHQFGFPVTIRPDPLPESLERFFNSGDPPVAWTHGSANFDIQHFQSRALAISREVGARCLLVSLDAPAGPLSRDVFHIAHARFEAIFPRCRAVVHHGGIGTTARCIASGVPQLIIPRSHDQPDNANRIVRLGLGKTLSYRRIDSSQLATTLRELLGSRVISARCQEFQSRVLALDTLSKVSDWAEKIAGTFGSRRRMAAGLEARRPGSRTASPRLPFRAGS